MGVGGVMSLLWWVLIGWALLLVMYVWLKMRG